MPEFTPAKITIDAAEYDYLKSRLAEIESADFSIHRQAIATLINFSAINMPQFGNTGFPILEKVQRELQVRGIRLGLKGTFRPGTFQADDIIIERITK